MPADSTFLPHSSVTYSSTQMQPLYQKYMYIVQKFGKIDSFTFEASAEERVTAAKFWAYNG
jgi:hypothetical protein